jgi:hypothetical protein
MMKDKSAMRVEKSLKGTKGGNRESNPKATAFIQLRERVAWV